MSDSYDVVVVGRGIAGSALAARLAREQRLGLYDTLIDAGGIHSDRWVQFFRDVVATAR